MINILDKIRKDLEIAQKRKDNQGVETLRLILAEIHNYEISKRRGTEKYDISDEEVVKIIQKEIKKRKEAKELFLAGKREDLALQADEEIKILSVYIPPSPSKEEILETINDLRSEGINDFNGLIREIMKKFSGRIDGKTAAEIIKESLK